MKKQKVLFTRACSQRVCIIICLFLSISQAYSQKDLGKLNSDGNQHKIHYLDTMYQDAIVPKDARGYLFLSAIGADGGYKRRPSHPNKGKKNVKGGKGALVQGWFKIGTGKGEIPPGATIRFMVGQKGAKTSGHDTGGGGGGGGTGIAYKHPDLGKWRLLLVAGGGGGGNGDCCVSGTEGASGVPYKTGQKMSGYREYNKLDEKNKRMHVGGSAFGAPGYESVATYQKEGWLEGLETTADGWRVGEPTGTLGSFYDTDKEAKSERLAYGGWGFGAGGAGDKNEAWPGGGGGYIGGRSLMRNNFSARGGESFINDKEMKVSGVYSRARGNTSNPEDGLAVYKLAGEGFMIQLLSNQGKCVSVVSNYTASNPGIRLLNCGGITGHRWNFVNNAIVSVVDHNKCLTLTSNNTSNGTKLQLYDCNNSNEQRWVYDGVSRQIQNGGNRNKCIDQKDGNIRIWDCLNIPGQQWQIDGATPVAIEGDIRVKNIYLAKDATKCLDLYNSNTDNKTNIQISDCEKNDKAQQWLFDGTFIRYYAHQDKCVDIAYRKMHNGTNIQLWDCSDSGAQQWVYDGITGTIRYKAQDKCLVAKGTNIELRDCDSSVDQRWGIRDANISFDPDKIRTIRWVEDGGKCLEVEKGRTTNATNIRLGNCDADEIRQQWTYDGVYLKYQGDPAMCLDLRYGKTTKATNIQLFTCHGGENQRWFYDNTTQTIRTALHWNKCVDHNNNDANIWIYDCKKNDKAQKWIIE